MEKKGQVNFGETFGIIFIVYIILVVGTTWYNNINSKELKEMRLDDQKQRAFEKYYYLSNLDLIHISKKGIVEKEYDLNALCTFAIYSQTEGGREYLRKNLKESIVYLKIYKTPLKQKTTPEDGFEEYESYDDINTPDFIEYCTGDNYKYDTIDNPNIDQKYNRPTKLDEDGNSVPINPEYDENKGLILYKNEPNELNQVLEVIPFTTLIPIRNEEGITFMGVLTIEAIITE